MSWGGPWSELKLACIEDYTKSYLQVMKNKPWCLQYVDAFAGSGLQRLKTTAHGSESVASLFGDAEDQDAVRLFIEGSPIRAIRASVEASRGFDEFFFIDANTRACKDLERRVASEFALPLPEMHFRSSAMLKKHTAMLRRLESWTTSSTGSAAYLLM
ncbi:MAG: three-Cys-motif partner protein TcmP [Coriobacteriia bacterium]